MMGISRREFLAMAGVSVLMITALQPPPLPFGRRLLMRPSVSGRPPPRR
jgi:hypothetical protein